MTASEVGRELDATREELALVRQELERVRIGYMREMTQYAKAVRDVSTGTFDLIVTIPDNAPAIFGDGHDLLDLISRTLRHHMLQQVSALKHP